MKTDPGVPALAIRRMAVRSGFWASLAHPTPRFLDSETDKKYSNAVRVLGEKCHFGCKPQTSSDKVLLMGKQFPCDTMAEAALLEGLPFLEIKLVTQEAFDLLVETIFASDREMQPKGMIEVVL